MTQTTLCLLILLVAKVKNRRHFVKQVRNWWR